MKHEPQIRTLESTEPRSTSRSLLRGWHKRCPSCGGGPLFQSYVKVRDRCAACGEPLHHHRADDFPAYITILVVGHIVVSGMVGVEFSWSPPIWVHWAAWPALTLVLSLWLLPRIKGMVVGMQWATRMHGFERKE